MPSTATLKISNGTTEVSLLRGEDGFFLNEDGWMPRAPQFKGGGTFQSSPLSDGRRLVNRQFDNVVETFALKAEGKDEDSVIEHTQNLRRLLEKAVDYWTTDWQSEPVWIEAQATCETNSRYALIYWYSTPNDDSPYEQPFLQPEKSAVFDEWLLLIERGHWLADEPGTSTCVEVSGLQTNAYQEDDIFVPTQNNDDGYQRQVGSQWINNLTFLAFGNGGAPDELNTGVLFRNVNITQGATITNAIVRFTAAVTDSSATVNTIISANDVDNATQIVDYTDYGNRVITSATVAWNNVPAFVAGNTYDTPDITAVIQEIVNRPNWITGNDILIFVKNNGSSIAATRQPASLENVTYTEPQLIISHFGRTVGRSATCENEVYISNKKNTAQLTHIFVDDGGAFGVNLIGAALPFNLLPAVPAVNDAAYFGIDTTTADSGPFSSLVFDIGTAQTNITDIDWEYWNGAAWGALTVQDNTASAVAFDTTEVGSVHWLQPSNWATAAVNGVTGYWVRARVNAVGGGPTAPTQQNRDIYTITWPHINIASSQVNGDIPAISRLNMTSVINSVIIEDMNRCLVGLRSDSRGENFTAFINFSDEQNPSNITVAVAGGGAFVNDVTSVTGRIAQLTASGEIARIDFDSTSAIEYYGMYRVFIRAAQTTGSAGDVNLTLTAQQGDASLTQYFERSNSFSNTGFVELLDFGRMTIPSDPSDSSAWNTVRLQVQSDEARTVDVHDIILLPIDEWALELRPADVSAGEPLIDLNEYFDIDSITNFRHRPAVFIRNSSDEKIGQPVSIANGISVFQSNADQKVWFLFDGFGAADPTLLQSLHEASYSVQAFDNQRYLSMRGSR